MPAQFRRLFDTVAEEDVQDLANLGTLFAIPKY